MLYQGYEFFQLLYVSAMSEVKSVIVVMKVVGVELSHLLYSFVALIVLGRSHQIQSKLLFDRQGIQNLHRFFVHFYFILIGEV